VPLYPYAIPFRKLCCNPHIENGLHQSPENVRRVQTPPHYRGYIRTSWKLAMYVTQVRTSNSGSNPGVDIDSPSLFLQEALTSSLSLGYHW
jgi:hypothetical protein